MFCGDISAGRHDMSGCGKPQSAGASGCCWNAAWTECQLENEYVLAGGSRQLSLYHGISSFLCILLSAGAARTDTGSGEEEAAGDFPLDNPPWEFWQAGVMKIWGRLSGF